MSSISPQTATVRLSRDINTLVVCGTLILTAALAACKKPEDKTLVPHPRNPPAASFESLKPGTLELGSQLYVDVLRRMPRLGALDYSADPPALPLAWTDEGKFHRWLLAQGLPRQLAEMLYSGAPEITFMAGSGEIYGVESLIKNNSEPETRNIRDAGFFIVGCGPNGDALVIDVSYQGTGAVGFFPIEQHYGKSAFQLKLMFIPFVKSIGEYLRLDEVGRLKGLPIDYEDSRKRGRKPLLPSDPPPPPESPPSA